MLLDAHWEIFAHPATTIWGSSVLIFFCLCVLLLCYIPVLLMSNVCSVMWSCLVMNECLIFLPPFSPYLYLFRYPWSVKQSILQNMLVTGIWHFKEGFPNPNSHYFCTPLWLQGSAILAESLLFGTCLYYLELCWNLLSKNFWGARVGNLS